jgi:hypothetical protein
MPTLILLLSLHGPIAMIFRILLPFVLIFSFILNSSGTSKPLFTAGRSLIVSSHFLTFGNGSSSTPAHSAQFTHAKHARSAIVHLSPTIQGPFVPGPLFGRVELEPPAFEGESVGCCAVESLLLVEAAFKDLVETFSLLC